MDEVESKAPEGLWFLQTVGEIGTFGSRLLRNFLKVSLIGLTFSVLLIFAVYLGTNDVSTWRIIAACATAIIMCGGLIFLSGTNLAVLFTLAETVKAKGLARRVLDGLFAELLGVTEDTPAGDYEETRKLHGMRIEDLRANLTQAGESMLSHRIATGLPRFMRWLLDKAQRVAIWATVRVVLSYATSQADENRKVDFLALRENLTAVVDDLVTKRITEGARRLALLAALVVTVVVCGLVAALTKTGLG